MPFTELSVLTTSFGGEIGSGEGAFSTFASFSAVSSSCCEVGGGFAVGDLTSDEDEVDCLGVFGCSCNEVIMTAICSWLGQPMMICSSEVKSALTSWRKEMKEDMTLF